MISFPAGSGVRRKGREGVPRGKSWQLECERNVAEALGAGGFLESSCAFGGEEL